MVFSSAFSTAVLAQAPSQPAAVVLAPVPELPPAEQGPLAAQDSQTPSVQNPQEPPDQDPQKPPAAVGEASTKPTRNFPSALVHNLEDDVKHMPRMNSLYWLAGGGALALAVHPDDNLINRHLEGSGAAGTFFAAGKYVGEDYTIVGAGLGVYILGRKVHSSKISHLGMDEIEASILTGAIVLGVKEAVRRQRPLFPDGTRASGFSFPSGHAMLTFSAATVLQQHLGYKWGIPTYLVATYVAMSRLHDNVHYASDVIFGAATGVMIGRTVTWHGRNFYGWNMQTLPMLLPKGAGVMVVVDASPAVSHR